MEDITIKLPAELTIVQVDTFKQTLLQIIDNNDTLVIDDNDLERIDTIGLQLLLSAITYIASQRKVLRWNSRSSTIKESIKKLGLNDAIFTQYLNP
jgi:anti-anti-sigma regulatory factor